MNESDLSNEILDFIPKTKPNTGMVGLKVFGIIGIVLGALSAYVLSKKITAIQNVSISYNINMIVTTAVQITCSVWLICMGIGSFKAKRWARALILTSSWVCLLTGLHYTIGWGLISTTKVDINWTSMYGFLSVCLIIPPAVLIAYYSQNKVKTFCEKSNPNPSWVDKCTLPVLTAVFFFVSRADTMIYQAGSNWALPFFGKFITSYQGMVIYILSAFACLGVAYGLYKQKTWAIWCGAILILAWVASSCITFYTHTMTEYFELFNTPEQMAGFEGYNIPNGFHRSLYLGAGLLIAAGYLIYIRKYFNQSQPEPLKSEAAPPTANSQID